MFDWASYVVGFVNGVTVAVVSLFFIVLLSRKPKVRPGHSRFDVGLEDRTPIPKKNRTMWS